METSKPTNAALARFVPDPGIIYPIDAVELLTGVPRRQILLYCRHGLIKAAADPMENPEWRGYHFDQSTAHSLRRMEAVRVALGIEVAALKILLGLLEWRRREPSGGHKLEPTQFAYPRRMNGIT